MSGRNVSSTFYLVLKRKGYSGLTGRMTARPPSLAGNEIALSLNVEVPAALFARPALSASVTVPEGASIAETITAEVADNVAEIIRRKTGLTVRISAEDQGSAPAPGTTPDSPA